MANLVPRAHVSFGQRQDTELWNNPFQECWEAVNTTENLM